MDDSDAALPKATVLKLVRESLPPDIRISADAQDVLVECATEFVKLLGTQANEVSGRQQKKTLGPEHVVAALEELGFPDLVADVQAHWQQFKEDEKEKPRMAKKTKAEASGLSEADQIAMQDRMFAEARARAAL
mmetsp:Transcript_15739/g.47405  ORF Transcript_15739/g.47405 Transcript_15739/m.47405 type:complete len:134 (+) Transcript_15739:56-457(+)